MSIGKINKIYYNEKLVRLEALNKALMGESDFNKYERIQRKIKQTLDEPDNFKPAYFLRWGKQTRELVFEHGNIQKDVLEIPTVIVSDAETGEVMQFEIGQVKIDNIDYLDLNDLSQFE